MNYLDYDALERTPLQRDPFDYVVAPDFIRAEKFAEVVADYPVVPGPGSHPPAPMGSSGSGGRRRVNYASPCRATRALSSASRSTRMERDWFPPAQTTRCAAGTSSPAV